MAARNIIAVVIFLLASTVARAQELVAIVDLKFIKETDRAAMVMCFGD